MQIKAGKVKIQVGQYACPVCKAPYVTQAGAAQCGLSHNGTKKNGRR